MPFNDSITQLSTLSTTHCDNFNDIYLKLLENTLFNKDLIGNLSTLTTQQKQDLVSAINEVKQSITSSTDITQTIDNKISTHNSSNMAHKNLKDALDILSNERGYVSTNFKQNISALSLFENGKYELYGSGITDVPVYQGNQYLDVYVDITWCGQSGDNGVATMTYVYPADGGTWVNTCENSEWAGWVKNATQDQINVLSDKALQFRGIITSISQIDKDGYYYVSSGDKTFPYFYGFLNVKSGGGEKVLTYDTTGDDKQTYKNVLRAGQSNWEGWIQLSTTSKTDILRVPRENKTLIYNRSYKNSMFFVIDMKFKNTDDSDFVANRYYPSCNGFPTVKSNYIPIKGACFDVSDNYIGDAYGYRWEGNIYMYPRINCKSIGVYEVCTEVIA